MNHDEVWDAFCGTYEAIYDILGEWQDWWNANGSGYTPPNMQDEWKAYIETVLESLVRRGRASFDLQYELAAMYVNSSSSLSSPFLASYGAGIPLPQLTLLTQPFFP
jgi:hypothetical protein